MTNQQKHIAVLQDENNRQWDEILMLRKEAKDHEIVVEIFLNKINRLKAEVAAKDCLPAK